MTALVEGRLRFLRRRPTRRVVATAAAVVLVGALSSCTLQTVGAKSGPLTLRADFPDVEGLVVGNTVQISNVVVGSVQAISLVSGYRAQVRMSIQAGHPIPVGTSATITQTSLLGEYFVALAYPPGFDGRGALVHNDALLADTTTEPDVEHLAGEVGQVVTALDAGDVSAIIHATAQALAGRGPELHTLIGELANLAADLQSQNGNIATIVDDLGQVGSTLAPLAPQVASLVDSLSSSTATLSADRQKLISALSGFTALAQRTNDDILVPHAQQFLQLTTEANAILGSLVQNGHTIDELFDNFALFVPRVTKAVSQAQLLVFIWADPAFRLGSAAPAAARTGQVAVPSYVAELLR